MQELVKTDCKLIFFKKKIVPISSFSPPFTSLHLSLSRFSNNKFKLLTVTSETRKYFIHVTRFFKVYFQNTYFEITFFPEKHSKNIKTLQTGYHCLENHVNHMFKFKLENSFSILSSYNQEI